MHQIGVTKQASCDGKAAMPSMRLAIKVARRMNDRGEKVHAYRCAFCHQFHVGSIKAR